MNKKIFLFILCLFLLAGIAWAAGEPQLTAPGGGEFDLVQNVVKYYGISSRQVEARWGDYQLLADYLEYHHTQRMIVARGRVVIYQNNTPEKRKVQSAEITFDLNKNLIIAKEQVMIQVDTSIRAQGGYLEWDRANDQFKLMNDPQIEYDDWKITGKIVEGQLKSGIMTLIGPVYGANQDTVIKAGRLIAERQKEVFYLQDNPVVIRGKNELSANEIIYDLKTKKVSAKGILKTKITENN